MLFPTLTTTCFIDFFPFIIMDIFQYNINGFYNNFHDLELIRNKHSPSIFALQETHCKKNEKPKFKGYNVLSKNIHDSASQGVALLIREGISFQEINLDSKILSVAAKVTLKNPITICSIYIHPLDKITPSDLRELIDLMPGPLILLGDFNAHHPLWNDDGRINGRGRIIENYVVDNDLALLNDRTPTYLHPGTYLY